MELRELPGMVLVVGVKRKIAGVFGLYFRSRLQKHPGRRIAKRNSSGGNQPDKDVETQETAFPE
jgi:hypothetical protein